MSTEAKAKKELTGKAAAIKVLTDNGGQMKVADVCRQAAQLAPRLKDSKTPEATIAAGIYTDAKKGKNFRIVERGVVELLSAEDAAPAAAETETPKDAASDPDSPAVTSGSVVLRDASAGNVQAKPDPKPTGTAKKSGGRGRAKASA